MRIWILVSCLLISACSAGGMRRNPNDLDNNLVEYQFIDADTMKPIQGAYVNAVWVTPTPPGKVSGSECVQAALLRSDANGWVKLDGPKGTILDALNVLVPGYEVFPYLYAVPDAKHVSHFVRAEKFDIDHYPEWAKTLIEQGYSYHSYETRPYLGYYKSYPIAGFVDNQASPIIRQKYFARWHSFPHEIYGNYPNVGNACGAGGVNIGLSQAERTDTDIQRALAAISLLCDKKWDSVVGEKALPAYLIATALWVVRSPAAGQQAWAEFKNAVPSYAGAYEGGRALSREERLAFCAWIRAYAEKAK
jgi:hypothetical protein